MPFTANSQTTVRAFEKPIGKTFLATVTLLVALGCGSAGNQPEPTTTTPASAASLSFPVEALWTSGNPANRINLVVLGDGYRPQDQIKLTQDATRWMSAFQSTPPYGNYSAYFNIKLVHVVSNEDGADNGMHGFGVPRDTALGAAFQNANPAGQSPDYRLLVVDNTKALAVAMANAPEFTKVVVLVNDANYGGSGGPVSVFSVNRDSCCIALHEFGHTLGDLADEYTCGDTTSLPDLIESYPNVTTRQSLEQIKWNRWIEPGTLLPTPDDGPNRDVLGLFKGAYYHDSGVYRPRHACRMRSLNAAFCEVCSEAIIQGIYARVSPIDSTSPVSRMELEPGSVVNLSATHPAVVPDTFKVTWTVDGAAVAGDGTSRVVDGSGLGPGIHEVSARLVDATPLVRSGPVLLGAVHTWTIHITGPVSPASMPSPDKDRHLLLHVVRDASGFRVLDRKIVDLPLPADPGPGFPSWRVEAVRDDGQIVFQSGMEDPGSLRGEFRNLMDPGRIDGYRIAGNRPASFVLRMPLNGATRINVYVYGPPGRGAGKPTFLGAASLPKAENP